MLVYQKYNLSRFLSNFQGWLNISANQYHNVVNDSNRCYDTYILNMPRWNTWANISEP